MATSVTDKGVFDLKDKTFTQQYSQVYFQRLALLKPILHSAAKKKWNLPESSFVETLLNISQDKEVCIVGTIYTEMPLKPNVLSDLSKGLDLTETEPVKKYWSSEISVTLEDESGRLELDIEECDCIFATGIVVALRGIQNDRGVFKVKDVCLPGLAPQKPFPNISEQKYILFASGLNFGGESVEMPFKFDLLIDYVSGCFEEESSAKIAQVVIVGNSIAKMTSSEIAGSMRYGSYETAFNTKPLELFDEKLSYLCQTVPVAVMPGENDPSNAFMPQGPIHNGLLSKSKKYSSLSLLANPVEIEVEGLILLGNSGQSIDDIGRYIETGSHLKIAENLLKWRNIAPTAPDTLLSYPFYKDEPFIIRESPHVIFFGNQPSFETALIEENSVKTRIILLPEFSKTGQVVLFDLQKCTPHVLQITLPNDEGGNEE